MIERLVWAEISRKNLLHNLNSIKKLTGPSVKMMAVVKANAYGHGAEIISKICESQVDYFGVVCLYEARELREAGIKKPILILNYIDGESLDKCVELDLSLNIMDENLLSDLDKIARRKNKRVAIHVKVDSGMHRLGLLTEDAIKFIIKTENYKNIILEGLFTHFATADEKSLAFTYQQLMEFNKVIVKLKEKKIKIPIIHAANSAATLRLKQAHFDMVRPGIILYGLGLSAEFELPFKPAPVMALKTKIVQIRRINKRETVGYGRTFRAEKETIVASIPVGYADGFTRAPKNWGKVLVRGQFANVVGRVSMDQSSIDITEIENAAVGDEVVLIGSQGKKQIKAEDAAKQTGTINYEIVARLANRVSRIIVD